MIYRCIKCNKKLFVESDIEMINVESNCGCINILPVCDKCLNTFKPSDTSYKGIIYL